MEKLIKMFPDIKKNVSLSGFSSFEIGGGADYFFRAKNTEDLISILDYSFSKEMPIFIFGGGSNTLFSDEGFSGLVIKNECTSVSLDGERIKAESGVILPVLVAKAKEKKLSGLEKLFGIPGTIGGAVFGNAGAYGDEISQKIEKVKIFTKNGPKEVIVSEKDFQYRHSRFKEKREIILEVVLKLKKVKEVVVSQEIIESRKRMNYHGNIGCFFKNPPQGPSAGELLDKVNAKKTRLGGARVSEKHANFIINTGQATCKDILGLVKILQKRVQDKFGILLEPEVNIVGNDFA